MYQPPSDAGIRAPLLEQGADEESETPDGQRRSDGGSDGSDEAAVLTVGTGPQLWAPLEYDAMSRWRWVDWCRYFFYR